MLSKNTDDKLQPYKWAIISENLDDGCITWLVNEHTTYGTAQCNKSLYWQWLLSCKGPCVVLSRVKSTDTRAGLETFRTAKQTSVAWGLTGRRGGLSSRAGKDGTAVMTAAIYGGLWVVPPSGPFPRPATLPARALGPHWLSRAPSQRSWRHSSTRISACVLEDPLEHVVTSVVWYRGSRERGLDNIYIM